MNEYTIQARKFLKESELVIDVFMIFVTLMPFYLFKTVIQLKQYKEISVMLPRLLLLTYTVMFRNV